jgi:hypothetical protein
MLVGEETKKQTEDGSPCLAFKDPDSLLDRQPRVKTAQPMTSDAGDDFHPRAYCK